MLVPGEDPLNMKHLPKEKRDQLILVCLGTLAAIVGIYYSVISSQRKSIENMTRQKNEHEAKLIGAERLASSINQFQKNLETAHNRLRAIESTMASGDMYSWVILTVNTFKENYRIDIPQFSREVPTEVGMFHKFPYRAAAFHLRGTAYFHDLGKFVSDFENNFPYMRIQNLELEPSAPSIANGPVSPDDQEKLAFKMEIVALVNPLQ